MGSRPALALLDILRGEGVVRVFGNPGTTELPFLAALSEAEDAPEYVLGVHEGPTGFTGTPPIHGTRAFIHGGGRSGAARCPPRPRRGSPRRSRTTSS